MTSFSITIVM